MIRTIAICLMSVGSCIAPLRAQRVDAGTPPSLSAVDTGPTAVGFEDASSNPLLDRRIPMPHDRVRGVESQQRAVLEAVKQQDRERQARQKAQQRQFEARFNQLVDAVARFAKEYNEGKGSTWPQREADKLRKAMRQLQSFEKSLRDDLTGRRRDTSAPEGIRTDE